MSGSADDEFELHAWPLRSRGGQHFGVSTGVLAVHRLSGIAVACADERSMLKNRETALRKLRAVLALVGWGPP